ncbi:hypothetical protein ACFLZV_02790 [Candidatus Margulisiibacteriota bacterium]
MMSNKNKTYKLTRRVVFTTIISILINCISIYAEIQIETQKNTPLYKSLPISFPSTLELEFAEYSDFRAKPAQLIVSENIIIPQTLVYYPEEEVLFQEQNIITPRLIGRALPYPNPMNFSRQGGEIGYLLSTDMDIELIIYDLRLNIVYRNRFTAGFQGGLGAYNKVSINDQAIGYSLPSGAYFYILVHNGKVLCREKFAVIR